MDVGLSQEFYAGDPNAIVQGFDAGELPWGVADRYADFSLHLSPNDLDLLSEVIAEVLGMPPILLDDALGPPIVSDDEHGIHVVGTEWVQKVAGLEETRVAPVCHEWIRRVGLAHGMDLPPSPDGERALVDLILPCRNAVQHKLPVVYLWYL